MPSHIFLSPHVFLRAASHLGCGASPFLVIPVRRYRSFFGVTPNVTSILWTRLLVRIPPKSEARHLLWALLFLKVYASEHVHAQLVGVSEKTFRKWCWLFVRLLSELEVVQWESRLDGRSHSSFKVSVDGTDFRVQEPTPFPPSWYSHKFKGAGLRYEIGVGIFNSNVVWAHGPFPCGSYNDLRIYRLGMKRSLLLNERVIADGGYKDPTCSYPLVEHDGLDFSYTRARHEAVNNRLKQFGVLGNKFRHRLSLHSMCFYAALNAVQLSIENGEVVFTNYG